MGLMDDMKAKTSTMMENDEMKEKIKTYAREHNCTLEEAKRHFMEKKKKQ